MEVTITSFTPNPPLQVPTGSSLELRGWYSNDFIAGDNVTPVQGGNGKSGFYYLWTCSHVNGNLVVPNLTVQATTESAPTAMFVAQLYVDGAPNAFIVGSGGAGWAIPTVYGASLTYFQLAQYNAASTLVFPPLTYLTATQTIALILQLAAQVVESTSLLGSLSANRIPRASTESTLVDSQIQDNGTTVRINTLNAVEIGDLDEQQNGSYISIDDTVGRVSFQAGGDRNAQYAGISAVAGVDQSEFYIQGSAGNGYSYGSFKNGVAKLGDGEDENNGTKIEIDDVNKWIKLHNLPTSDPGEANVLWKDGTVINISAG